MKKYFQINTLFRNESYNFVVQHAHYLKMTDKDVTKIVCEKFKTIIPGSEISYTEKEILETDYNNSKLDKYSPDVKVSQI